MRKIVFLAAAVGAAAWLAGTASASAVKAAGGTMEREQEGRPNSTAMIGIAVDPAGNRIEMIQPGSRK